MNGNKLNTGGAMKKPRHKLTSRQMGNLDRAYRNFGKNYRQALIDRAKIGKRELLTRQMASQILKIAGSETKAIRLVSAGNTRLDAVSYYTFQHILDDIIYVINKKADLHERNSLMAVATKPRVTNFLRGFEPQELGSLFRHYYANEIEQMSGYSAKAIQRFLPILNESELLLILKKITRPAAEKLAQMDAKDIKKAIKKLKEHNLQEFSELERAIASGKDRNHIRFHWLRDSFYTQKTK
ncbi:Uncharacterised protein [uncultured archaeon]|nr:Uncharacterised protein [uncultured archaeon]